MTATSRARRLHRPLPDRPRGRRRGGRRPDLRLGRHLEPPLVLQPAGRRPRRPDRRQHRLQRRRVRPRRHAANPVPNNPTGVWVGDYTIQPENGGLGVFAHEFGHDLGLPDLYDTSGNTGGAENSTGFWTLMSSGSNIGDGGDTHRRRPDRHGRLGAVPARLARRAGRPGPLLRGRPSRARSPRSARQERAGDHNGAQALITLLPDKRGPAPARRSGAGRGARYMFWSTQGDNLNTTMTKTGIPAPPHRQGRTTRSRPTGTTRSSRRRTTVAPRGRRSRPTCSDTAGTTRAGSTPAHRHHRRTAPVDLTATLPAGTNAIRFRYQTDGAAVESGFRVDDIAVDGTVIGTAETETEGWTFDGFSARPAPRWRSSSTPTSPRTVSTTATTRR